MVNTEHQKRGIAVTEAKLNSSLFSLSEGLAKVILKPLSCRELALFHRRSVEILYEV